MEDGRPSVTAEGAAVMRALHQTPDHEPKILDDPISFRLVDSQTDFYRSRLELLRQLPTPTRLRLEATFVMRSRYTEDCLSEAFDAGVRQCVLLGAGLDTFAYRQPSWASSVRIFEIDHPVTQQWKRKRLADAGITVPGNVHFVPVDFENATLATTLSRAGVGLDASAFFAMLGVSQYLTEVAFEETLSFVLSMPNSSGIVFSFVATDVVLPPDDIALVKAFSGQFAAIGEPWRSRFAPTDLVAKLTAMGFAKVFHLTPEKANQRYFQNRRDGLNAAIIEQMISAGV